MTRKKINEVIKSGKYLKLVIRDGWEYVERVNSSGVVIIVTKTRDDKVILVEQFRRPVKKNVIGFPAGLVGDEHGTCGEPPALAARRELLEETGYLAKSMKKLFYGPIAAGMCKDMVRIYYAADIKKVSSGGGIGDWEKIKVHEVPLATIDGWLKRQEKKGLLVAPNVFSGIYFLKHWVK
ncbi:MAG: NUDIX hydrolase [Candidatus Omnitrophica bacterium]|nr:NUDIX hydrolase [Candidatus Omnitrophota bacterium]